MSDMDEFMMEGSDDDIVDWPDSNDEGSDAEDDADLDIQNQYYTSKGDADDDPQGALEGLKEVVAKAKLIETPDESGEREKTVVKAMKQIVKLDFKLGNKEQMSVDYKEFLSLIGGVTRNESEKYINSILECVSNSSDVQLLQQFYQTTLDALETQGKNERLWFKTSLKLGELHSELEEYGKVAKILKDLKKSCQKPDGSDDTKKGTQLMEVYALEIRMHTATKHTKKLKELYHKALSVRSGIPHPRIMAVIKECGGKMYMAEEKWQEAQSDFFDAFKNYDEAGFPRRIQCLKYMLLAAMLSCSKINPFEAAEARSYKNDPDVEPMRNLIEAYQANKIRECEQILDQSGSSIMDDPFIRSHVEELMKSIRSQVLLRILGPYTRVRIPFLSKELNVTDAEVETLVVGLILDNKISGKLDQVNGLLLLDRDLDGGSGMYAPVNQWAHQVGNLHRSIAAKLMS